MVEVERRSKIEKTRREGSEEYPTRHTWISNRFNSRLSASHQYLPSTLSARIV